jgi:hypothetical protein
MAQNGAASRLFRNRGAEPGLRVRLAGPPGNPDAVGATIRLLGPEWAGPAREVRAGSGTWSQDGAVQVLGGRERATAVRVRWPGGRETTTPLEPGTAEVVVRAP